MMYCICNPSDAWCRVEIVFQELEWGGGLKQRDNSEAEKEELSRIAAQPFARFEPDEAYMKELMLGQVNKSLKKGWCMVR